MTHSLLANAGYFYLCAHTYFTLYFLTYFEIVDIGSYTHCCSYDNTHIIIVSYNKSTRRISIIISIR